MPYPTKVQLINRKNSKQWYIHFPSAVAQMMDFFKRRSGGVVAARPKYSCAGSAGSAAFVAKKNETKLLSNIESLITESGQPERVRRHLLSQLLCLGRHTITGLLGTHGRLFEDWSADYRLYQSERCDSWAIFRSVRQRLTAQLQQDEPLVVALDDTVLRKTGTKIHGVKYARDPLGPKFHVNFIRAQRFLQLSMAAGSPER